MLSLSLEPPLNKQLSKKPLLVLISKAFTAAMDVRDVQRYTIGWISPLPLEKTAAKASLDEDYGSISIDGYSYDLGRIGEHSVVLGIQSRMGTDAAASLATRMRLAFANIDYFMVVGIAGGVPRYGPYGASYEIVLGDVVVSTPRGNHGGVFRYDTGAWSENGQLNSSGHTNSPPDAVLAAVGKLRSEHSTTRSVIPGLLKSLRDNIEPKERSEFEDPGPHNDILYDDDCIHPQELKREHCEYVCDPTKRSLRRARGTNAKRETDKPVVHYGGIASSNQLQKSATNRNRLHLEHDVIAFEMEGAGVMLSHDCLVIRGICDYSDSHKNKRWQGYAAATAASYTKELLWNIPPSSRAQQYSKAALAKKLSMDTLRRSAVVANHQYRGRPQ
jgi:nucleoside phosphorylase